MGQISRRYFNMLLGAGLLRGAARQPDYRFPTQPEQRLAVATYPFRKEIGSRKTLAQFAAEVPGTFDLRGIEPWSHHFESLESEYLQHLHEALKSHGVRVVNIPVDIKANLCGGAEERSAALESYRKWVDAAVLLESPSIRVHLPSSGKSAAIECAVSGLGALAEYGASKNIVINIENDDPKSEQPERIVRVIKAVKSPYLRALPDFANSMVIHNDQNYNRQSLSLLFPLAYNVCHVKNMLQDGKNVFRVDLDHLFAIAKESRYKGFFSMEWDAEGDPYEGTRQLIKASLRNLH